MKLETKELKQKINEFIDELEKTDDEKIEYVPKGYILVHAKHEYMSTNSSRKDKALIIACDKIVSVMPIKDNACLIEVNSGVRYFVQESLNEIINLIIINTKK